MRISDWSSDVCSSDLPAHPMLPFGDGVIEHMVERRGDLGREALVGAEEEVQRPLDAEQPLVAHPADRGGGRKPEYLLFEQVAEMGGAVRLLGHPLAPVARGAQPAAEVGRAWGREGGCRHG